MKTLLLAATTMLSISMGSAFAESGGGWDMAQMLSTATPTARPAQPQPMAQTPYNGVVIAYNEAKSCGTASELAALPRNAMPQSASPRSDTSWAGYPLNWGSG
jgi:hypothetical protein